MDLILSSIPYYFIETIGLNHMWYVIYNLILTNNNMKYIITHQDIITIYKNMVRNHIKLKTYNNLLLPSSVLAYIYPKTISFARNQVKYILPPIPDKSIEKSEL